jgi:hypothetical protein
MKPIYLTNSEENRNVVKNLPKGTIVSCICHYCHELFEIERKQLLRDFLKESNKGKNKKFCSHKCSHMSMTTSLEVQCKNCNKNFKKRLKETKYSPNHFCSRSCAATYNNKHKTHGTRRSKMEVFFEEIINLNYSNLKYLANDKTVIGSELDFYFPDLKFAIELNGIFHYEPIYGDTKFNQIQNNDKQKLIRCYEKGIELCIVDISSVSYLSSTAKEKYKKIFCEILDKVKNRR